MGWLAVVVAAISPFNVAVEKAHGPAQSPPEPQFQRREEDLAIQMPDEGPHRSPPTLTPPATPPPPPPEVPFVASMWEAASQAVLARYRALRAAAMYYLRS